MGSAALEGPPVPAAGNRAPHPAWVHLALFGGQLSFGFSAIAGKLGLHGGNPLLFGLLRELITGLILCVANLVLGYRALPDWADMQLFLGCGFAIFLNHICYLVGLKLADPVSGSAWQPSQPVFTCGLAIMVGYERSSLRKSVGILIAVAGAVFMVLDEPASGTSATDSAGHFLFCANCMANSCYFIISKRLLKRYHPISLTGWSYAIASVFMLAANGIANSSSLFLAAICADDDAEAQEECFGQPWHIPAGMVLPLCFYILLGSIGAYFLVAWANQYAKASVVSAYTVVQTLTSSVVSWLLIACGGYGWAHSYGLRPPGTQDLGVIPILIGLAILFGEPTMDEGHTDKREDAAGSPAVPVGRCGVSEWCTCSLLSNLLVQLAGGVKESSVVEHVLPGLLGDVHKGPMAPRRSTIAAASP